MKDTIEHTGIIEQMDGMHLRVRIVQTSACSTCVAKGHCNASESKEKLIDVFDSDSMKHTLGETVTLIGSTSMGMQAVLWAFGVPFLVVVFLLFFCKLALHMEDLFSGLAALASLIPYCGVIYLLRNKFAKKFSFKIKPIIK